MKTKHYVVFVFGDVEPNSYGPYVSTEKRDQKARALRKLHGEAHGIYWARVNSKGTFEIGAYSGAFFNE